VRKKKKNRRGKLTSVDRGTTKKSVHCFKQKTQLRWLNAGGKKTKGSKRPTVQVKIKKGGDRTTERHSLYGMVLGRLQLFLIQGNRQSEISGLKRRRGAKKKKTGGSKNKRQKRLQRFFREARGSGGNSNCLQRLEGDRSVEKKKMNNFEDTKGIRWDRFSSCKGQFV